jgi:hypothetical protein
VKGIEWLKAHPAQVQPGGRGGRGAAGARTGPID